MLKRIQLLIALLSMLGATPAFAAADDDTVTVRSGDSLYRIVRLHYPDSQESWAAISRDIVRLNPQAFPGGDPGSLRVGVELTMPDYDQPQPQQEPMPVPAEAAATAPAPEAPPPPQQHALAIIGEITEVRGQPIAIDINNEQRELSPGSKVYRGDALLSDGGGSARAIMNDGAKLLLRPLSRIVIDDYTFIEAQPKSSRSVITLLKGGLRVITGLIGKRNPESFSVRTTVATIGIRGTDFAAMVCAQDECLLPDTIALEAGAYSGVLDGAIALGNDAGEFPVVRGEVMRTVAVDAVPEPAPEAAQLLFTSDELAMLEPEEADPMNFLQWLRSRVRDMF